MKASTKFLILWGMLIAGAAISVFGQQVAESDVTINRKPLKDFEEAVRGKFRNGKLDLSKSFRFEYEGVLDRTGKLDPSKSRIINREGDEQIMAVVRDALEAASAGGWFQYLRQLDTKTFLITASQNEQWFNASLIGDAQSIERARTIASGLNMLILTAQNLQAPRETERMLLNGTKVSSKDAAYEIVLVLPSERFQELIRKEIDKKANSEQR